MGKLRRRIHIELSHFKALSEHGQKLLLSIGLYNMADPLLWTFVSAFLWREYQSVNIVALYNFAAFCGLPAGYYVNGLPLKYFRHKSLYLFGSVVQGLIVTILLFMPHLPIVLVFLFGLAFGFGSGFFWSNKAFLTLQTTNTNNRIYFSSLDTISANIAKIIMPLGVGWFIVFGSKIHLYSEKSAYQILAILLLALLFLIGYLIKEVDVVQKPIKSVSLQYPSPMWQWFRLFTAIGGLYGGVAIFVSVLIVLKFVGDEESLGTIQSAAAAFSTLAVYVIARKAQVKHRIYIMCAGIVLALLSTFTFGVLYSSLGVVLYYILNAPSFPFRWVSEAPLGYDVIEHEERIQSEHHYSYIVDQETFVNIGRNVAIVIFLVGYAFFPDIALRWSLAIGASFQVIRLAIARKLERELHLSRTRMQEPIEEVSPFIK